VIQQTEALTAPPRDPTEVLIEEVRQRTRRRRRRNFGLAALVLAAGSGIYIACTAGNGSPQTGAGAPPISAVPSAVTAAINKTLGVQSVEVLMSYEPGPGIYQAPDLYYTPLGGGGTPKIGRVTASFIAGDTKYFATSKGTGFRGLLSNAEIGTTPPLREIKGLSVAQQAAFGIVDFVRSGIDFVSAAVGTYTFHLALVTGPDHADIRYTGGEITLAHGYVASVRLNAVASSEGFFTATPTTVSKKATRTTTSRTVAGTIVVQYKRIDHNPRLVAPRPNTKMCLPSGSLVLENC
jgi:hypothetical protein